MESERPTDNEGSWRARLLRLAGALRSGLRPDQSSSIEEELRWIEARPTFYQLQEILDESPREETLDSDQRNILKYLREVRGKSKDLAVKIEEALQSSNIKKLQSLWSRVIELGVWSDEIDRLAKCKLEAESILKARRAVPWEPKPLEMTFDELRHVFESWEKGSMIQDDYLFGLVENNKEFLAELLKDVQKSRKLSANLSEESLKEWLRKLSQIQLTLGIEQQIDAFIQIRESLRAILNLVQKTESNTSKNNSLMSRIVEEITSWNRKNLNEEEFKQFKTEEYKIKMLEGAVDSKDYDWVQFQNKMSAYEWRQEVRLKTSLPQGPAEEEIQYLLKRAPKELKASKCWEWTSLVEKAKNIEWFDDKQILDKIISAMNEEMGPENKDQLLKLISNANISAVSDDTIKKVNVLEKVVNSKCVHPIDNIQELEDLVKEMLEAKFWNTKVFAHFDAMQRVIQSIHHQAGVINAIKQKLEHLANTEVITIELVKQTERLLFDDVNLLLEDFAKLPDKLTSGCLTDFQTVDHEMRTFKSFIGRTESKIANQAKRIFDVFEGKKLQACKLEFDQLIRVYFTFAIRHPSLEENFEVLQTLIRACDLLEKTDPADSKDIGSWDIILNEVKRFWKDESKQPEIVKALEVPLSEAKTFLKVVHQIKHGSDQDKQLINLEDVKRILKERLANPGRICMAESIEFLNQAIKQAEEVEALLSKDRVPLESLKSALNFMHNISIQFDGKIEIVQSRVEQAESFKEKMKSVKDDRLEKDFEVLTEEYNQLGVAIPEIEEIFNSVQECKNLRRDAERLLQDSEETSIREMMEMKTKLMKMKYFRSANIIGRILAKLFYMMREAYESNSEQNSSLVEYCDMCKLIGEAQLVLSKKCRDEVKAELKEKTGFLNQIFKDVNDHLNKTVYILTLKQLREQKPEETFRGFVKIQGPILDYKKKMEEKEEQAKASEEAKKRRDEEKRRAHQVARIEGSGVQNDNRNYYCKVWRELISSNKVFPQDPKDASHIVKTLEREVLARSEDNPGTYERQCEEISRLLKEITPYQYISNQIHQKRFNMKAFKELFGKTSAEIRNLNYSLSKPGAVPLVAPEPQVGQSLNPKPEPMKEERMELSRPRKPEAMNGEEETKDIHQQTVVGDYMFYRIYNGDILLESKDNAKFERVQLLTCNKASLVSKFSFMPQNLSLSTKITKEAFIQYIQKVLAALNTQYRLLPGYLGGSSPDRMKRLYSALIEKDMVASKQYTDRCKVFIFPRDFIQKDWLDQLDFVTVAKDAELLYFLVLKLYDAQGRKWSNSDTCIVPEPMVVNGTKAFRLIFNGKVKDHNISAEHLKETKSTKPQALIPGLQKHHHSQHIEQMPNNNYHNSNERKHIFDLVKNAEEKVSKALRSYSKAAAQQGLNDRVLAPTGAISRPSYRGIDSREQSTAGYGYNKKYNHQMRNENWSSKENSLERLENGFDTNDLIGTLQNVKPAKSYFNRQPQYQPNSTLLIPPTFSENLNLINTNGFGTNPSAGTSGISKLLTKRAPNGRDSGLLSDSGLLMRIPPSLQPISDPSQGSPGYESKSFLQNAINMIQVPSPSMGGMMPQTGGYDKHGKKNSFATLMRSENYFKKKSSYGSSGGAQGGLSLGSQGGGGHGTMPIEFIKNQFF